MKMRGFPLLQATETYTENPLWNAILAILLRLYR